MLQNQTILADLEKMLPTQYTYTVHLSIYIYGEERAKFIS